MQKKPQFTVPEVSDSVTRVLLRHVNYRISAYLQSVYPKPLGNGAKISRRSAAEGGTGRISYLVSTVLTLLM